MIFTNSARDCEFNFVEFRHLISFLDSIASFLLFPTVRLSLGSSQSFLSSSIHVTSLAVVQVDDVIRREVVNNILTTSVDFKFCSSSCLVLRTVVWRPMPREFGLGVTLRDRENDDGDIDFDFFDDDDEPGEKKKKEQTSSYKGKEKEDQEPSSDNGSVQIEKPSGREVEETADGGALSLVGTATTAASDEEPNNNNIIINHHQQLFMENNKDHVQDDPLDEEDDVLDDDDEEEDDTYDSSSSLSDDLLDDPLSDSDITDVTPLSSANQSPLPSSPGHFAVDAARRSEAASFANAAASSTATKRAELAMLVRALLDAEHERNPKQVSKPRNIPRKNVSFSDDQVRRIDRENQLLLKKIFDSQRAVAQPVAIAKASKSPRVSSSAINRQRQQKRIEAENALLLKRIQSVKPTRELSRAHLLKAPSRSGSRPSSAASTASASVAEKSQPSSLKSIVSVLRAMDVGQTSPTPVERRRASCNAR